MPTRSIIPWTRPLAAAFLLCAIAAGCDGPAIQVKEPTLKVLEEQPGAGPAAAEGDVVTVALRVERIDGAVVMSDDRFRFVVGSETVIAGFDEAVRGMRIGGRRVVRCPPHKHWGRGGYADDLIAAREDLVFHLRLLAAEPSK